MTQLYLGLNPKNYPLAIHYPVIRTEICMVFDIPHQKWNQFTHVIFTSQTAVHYWPGPWDKPMIAIGYSTAHALREKGCDPLIAPFPTQEGVIELIKKVPGSFFWPRSKIARPILTQYCNEQQIPLFTFDLYETHFQKLEPIPNLELIDEIIFTSPSTVEGFLRIYGKLPKGKKLTAIGPITQQEMNRSSLK